MEADREDAPRALSAEDLLWQALALTRRLWSVIDALDIDLPEGTHHLMIDLLNRLDEHIFFEVFESVPGMYDEDEYAALARERHFQERFGDLADALDLPDTIRLDASDGDAGEFEAIDQLEGALDAITDTRRELEQITGNARSQNDPETRSRA